MASVSTKYHPDYMNPETNKHDRMKLLGRKILLYMGVHSNNIREEVTVGVDGKTASGERDKTYRIDLVGTLGGIKIGIECGDNKAEKIDALRKELDVVLILPYKEFDFDSQPEIKLFKKAMNDFEQSTLQTYEQELRLKTLQKNYDKLYDQIKYEIEKEQKQIREDYLKLAYDINESHKDLLYLKVFQDFCKKFANGELKTPELLDRTSLVIKCNFCNTDNHLSNNTKSTNGKYYCRGCSRELVRIGSVKND